MQTTVIDPNKLARYSGFALLSTIIVGILTAVFIVNGIDINLTADVQATAENMLNAEQRLRAKAYIAGLLFALEVLFLVGLYLLLRSTGQLLAAWSLFIGLSASVLGLLGAVFALNAAEFTSNVAYSTLANDSQLLMLLGMQATSDYTSFHLSLIISSIAKAGFFVLFLRSQLIPKLIAAWGVFASLFVAIAIVARDFIPLIGHNTVTMAFMLANMIALLATGIYLSWKGVKNT